MKSKLIALVVSGVMCSSAFAHGHDHLGEIAAGLIIGGAVVNAITPRPVYQQPYPVYQQPRTTYETNIYYPRQPVKSCVMYPVYDQYGVVIGQQNVCDYR